MDDIMPNIFNPDGHQIPSKRLSDEEYTAAISAFVVVNTDILLIDRKSQEIILPYRKTKPAEGLWAIGGRRRAGETAVEAGVRIMQREAGVSLVQERFTFLTINEYIWSYRKEYPTNTGRHDVHYVFTVELSKEELEHIEQHLDPTEYDGTKGLIRCTKSTLQKHNARSVLLDYYDRIF